MDITSTGDIKIASGEMHDSEFSAEDFGFNAEKKIFFLKSHSAENTSKEFYLQFSNVEKYDPVNLERVKIGKATAGVFNKIKIKNKGLFLELISQDLKILLRLSKLEGRFGKINSVVSA